MTSKYSDLGSPEVHQRHSVMVEGGTVPRAKVMDQSLIDRYLMDGLLTLQEPQAGEYVMASEALMKYGRTLDLVGRRFGPYAKYLVEEVVIHGWDISDNSNRLKGLKKSLAWISERRMMGGKNPMRHMQKS